MSSPGRKVNFRMRPAQTGPILDMSNLIASVEQSYDDISPLAGTDPIEKYAYPDTEPDTCDQPESSDEKESDDNSQYEAEDGEEESDNFDIENLEAYAPDPDAREVVIPVPQDFMTGVGASAYLKGIEALLDALEGETGMTSSTPKWNAARGYIVVHIQTVHDAAATTEEESTSSDSVEEIELPVAKSTPVKVVPKVVIPAQVKRTVPLILKKTPKKPEGKKPPVVQLAETPGGFAKIPSLNMAAPPYSLNVPGEIMGLDRDGRMAYVRNTLYQMKCLRMVMTKYDFNNMYFS